MSWNNTRPNNTRQARTMRTRVLAEEPTCRACGAPSTHDDHIIGWSERETAGLTIQQWHARSNHQALCESCHDHKTKAERARGQARRQAAPKVDRSKRPTAAHPGQI